MEPRGNKPFRPRACLTCKRRSPRSRRPAPGAGDRPAQAAGRGHRRARWGRSGRPGLCVGTRVSRVPGAAATMPPDAPGVHPACTGRSSERASGGPPGVPPSRGLETGAVRPHTAPATPHGRRLWQVGPTGRCREPGGHDPARRSAPAPVRQAGRGSQHSGRRRRSAVHAAPGRALGRCRRQEAPSDSRQAVAPAARHCPRAGPMPARHPRATAGPGRPCDASPSGLPARGGRPGQAGGAGAALPRAGPKALTCRDPGSSPRSPRTGRLGAEA